MDFVKKKAIESQLNKVGKELGLGSNVTSGITGSSREHERQSQWSVFPSMRGGDGNGNGGDEEAPVADTASVPFPTRAAEAFDSRARNFPPFLNLFYVERGILSAAARLAVDQALRVLVGVTALLLLNLFANALYTGLDKGKGWVDLLIGGIVGFFVAVVELVAFDTAFRGAYRSSTVLRQRYLGFGTANVVLFGVYAFLSVSFFHGWAYVATVNEEDKDYRFWARTLTLLEAFGWTGLSLYNMYAMFDYYHFYKGKEQGLSAEALESAMNAQRREAGNGGGGGGGEVGAESGAAPRGRRAEQARIREIRDRYRTADMTDG